jgi:hypothetical protein
LLNVRSSGGKLKIAISVKKTVSFLKPPFITFFFILEKTDSARRNRTKIVVGHVSYQTNQLPNIPLPHNVSPNARMGRYQQSCNDRTVSPRVFSQTRMNIPHYPEARTEGILLPYKSYRKATYNRKKKTKRSKDKTKKPGGRVKQRRGTVESRSKLQRQSSDDHLLT